MVFTSNVRLILLHFHGSSSKSNRAGIVIADLALAQSEKVGFLYGLFDPRVMSNNVSERDSLDATYSRLRSAAA